MKKALLSTVTAALIAGSITAWGQGLQIPPQALLGLANTWAAIQTFTLAPVFTDQSGTRTALGLTPAASAVAGQFPGTATNDNASAGNVGQYISASTADTGAGQGGSTVTITNASPGVITWGTTIPYVFNGTGCAGINFTTSGALPTGLVVGTNYYVGSGSVSGNTFSVATTCANAIAGTYINTSSAGSGTHTGVPTVLLTSSGVTTFDVLGLSLTAGDWDVTNDIAFFSNTTTSITLEWAVINTVTATLTSIPSRLGQEGTPALVPGQGNNLIHVGPTRISLSGTSTVFCSAGGNFTISTLASWGGCHARRVR